ncbi:hypothetical protein EYR36_002151 [Pleurotus pulmonarius]|nr:hypothetical protein EYR36_002151 [Pleurotus pulmonarius]
MANRARYRSYIRSYVKSCPIHLFDCELEQLITRDILAIRMELRLRNLFTVWMEVLRPVVVRILDAIESREEDEFYHRLGIEDFMGDTSNCAAGVTRPELAAYLPPDGPASRCLRALFDHLFNASVDARRQVIEAVGRYAILSHRWEEDDEELTFDCLAKFSERAEPVTMEKRGFKKFRQFCEVAASHACRFVWIDSGCIDRSDSNELEDSIASMFEWYSTAYVAIAYLRETPQHHIDESLDAMPMLSMLTRDPWFRRGWTLQEYYAPRRLRFYYGDWEPCPLIISGNRHMLLANAMLGSGPKQIDEFEDSHRSHVMKILKVMDGREATLPEDMAYCLFSILGVKLNVAYGEGYELAIYRLQVELITTTSKFDHGPYEHYQLFMWSGKKAKWNSMIAKDHGAFSITAKKPRLLACKRPDNYPRTPVPISIDSHNILSIQMTLLPIQICDGQLFVERNPRLEILFNDGVGREMEPSSEWLLGLMCEGDFFFGVILRKISNEPRLTPVYERIGCLVGDYPYEFDEALARLPLDVVCVGLSAGHPKELVSGTRLGSPLLPTSEGPGIDGASLPPVEDFQLRLARRLRSLPNWRDRSVKDLDEGPELSFEWIASQAIEAWQWKNEILESIENQREDFRYLENSIAEFIENVADYPGDVTRPELAVYLPPSEKNSRYLRATLNHLFNLTIHARRTVIEMVGRYAILSHRWEGEDQELTFDCLKYFSERSVMGRKHGFAKLRGFCEVAASYRCRFVWIDSGCINRKDHGELEVSISSMYEWYRNAYVTVAYLRETHQPQVDVTFNAMLFSQISRDPWFRRGWTLQEYYAPQRLRFYYGDWELCPLEIGRDQAMRLGDAAFGSEDDPNVLSMFMDTNTLDVARQKVEMEHYDQQRSQILLIAG